MLRNNKQKNIVVKNPNCQFCTNIQEFWEENIFETKNFRIRIGVGVVGIGHCMIVSKDHYKCMGDLPKKLIPEYLDLKKKLIDKISEKISIPFMAEYGVFGQSISHAHTHFIPSKTDKYSKVNIIQELVLPNIKKHKIPFEITDIYGLKKIYKEDGEYLAFEQNDKMYVVRTKDLTKEEIFSDFSYRDFFVNKNVCVKNWKIMTKEQKIKDKKNVKETKRILDF